MTGGTTMKEVEDDPKARADRAESQGRLPPPPPPPTPLPPPTEDENKGLGIVVASD